MLLQHFWVLGQEFKQSLHGVDGARVVLIHVLRASKRDPVGNSAWLVDQNLLASLFKAWVVAKEDLKRAKIAHHVIVVRVVLESVQIRASGLVVVSANLSVWLRLTYDPA